MSKPPSTISEKFTNADIMPTCKHTLKQRIYLIYYEIMQDRAISTASAHMLFAVAFLQLISYIFNRTIGFPIQDNLYDFTSNLVGYVRIIPPIEENKSYAIYLLYCFASVALIIIYFSCLFYIDYSLKISKFALKFPIGLASFLSCIFYWVLLTPTTEALLKIFQCSNGYHIIIDKCECWSPLHIVYCIIFALAFASFLLAIFLSSVLYNEFRSISLDMLSRLDNNFELYFACYRVVAAIVTIFARDHSLQWLLIIIYLVGAVYLLYYFVSRIPYHNKRVSEFFGTCVLCNCSTCITLLVAKLLEGSDYTGEIISIIISFIVSYYAAAALRSMKVNRVILSMKYDKIKESYNLDIYTRKLEELITEEKRSQINESMLFGYILQHRSECTNECCPLKTEQQYYLPARNATSGNCLIIKDMILLLHMLDSIYKEYAYSQTATASVHIIYSFFLLNRIGNIHQALMELSIAENCKTTYQQKLSILRMKKYIEHLIKERYKKSSEGNKQTQFADTMIVIEFEAIFHSFQKSIEQSCMKYIEFWTHLNYGIPDLNLLHKLGLSIIYFSKRTHELWNKLCTINPNYPAALQIYGIYLMDIRNDEELGNQFIDKGKKIRDTNPISTELNEYDTLFSEWSAILVMSGTNDSQGKIIKTNCGVLNLLGYNSVELIGKDVSIVIPDIIGKHHHAFVNEYFTTGHEKIMNKERKVFALTRAKCLIHVSLAVKLSSCVENEICYIALMVETIKEGNFILTDVQGKIDSMSKSILDKFDNESVGFFQENVAYLHMIFPELNEKVVIKDCEMTKFDAVKSGEVNYVNMYVPRTFTGTVQKFTEQCKELVNEKDYNNDEHENEESISAKLYKMFQTAIQNSSQTAYANPILTYFNYNDNFFFEEVKIEINDEVYGASLLRVRVVRLTFNNAKQNQSQDESQYKEFENKQVKNKLLNQKSSKHLSKLEAAPSEESEHSSKKEANFNIKLIPIPKTNDEQALMQPDSERKFIEKSGCTNNDNDTNNIDEILLNNNKKDQENKQIEDNNLKEKAKQFNADETGSMVSTNKKILGYIKKLKSAMYDKSVPKSVKQLKLTSNVLFVVLIALAAIFYAMQHNIYNDISDSIQSIYSSNYRAISVAAIEYSMRMLTFLAKGIVKPNRGIFGNINYNDTTMPYENWTRNNLDYYGVILKEAQNNLSTSNLILSISDGVFVNPPNITITYTQLFGDKSFLSYNVMDCWSSMMSLVIHAHKISEASLLQLSLNTVPDSASYILDNALNTIITSINSSSSVILDNIQYLINLNSNILKIILSASSVTLVAAVFLLFPITYRVASNKGKLLSLFIDINSKDVKEQLNKCRTSFNNIRGESDKPEEEDNDKDSNSSIGDNFMSMAKKNTMDMMTDTKNGDSNTESMSVHMKKKRMFKPYKTKVGIAFTKLIIFLLFLQSYFLLSYFVSDAFFIYTSHTITELYYITDMKRSNSLILYSLTEMIGTLGKASIYGYSSAAFVRKYNEAVVKEQEELLNVHSINYDEHGQNYNDKFDIIMYNDTCSVVFDNSSECTSFMSGILKMGLNSANIAFWNKIREFYTDYNNDTSLLSEDRFINVELLNSRYFSKSYEYLSNMISQSMADKFSTSSNACLIVFICYSCAMCLLNYIFWSIFLKSTNNSLWVTKSMLSIIPPEIIQKVKKITDFLVNTTSLSLSAES